MRQLYAHDALVKMNPRDDPDAIGAAVTVALCGDWKHEPPCPLAPHHTRTERSGDDVQVRTLFAAEPSLEGEVRERIDHALRSGGTATWRVLTSAQGVVEESERDHGERLIRS